MREWQGRRHALRQDSTPDDPTDDYVQWPAAQSCDGSGGRTRPAPPFPPDGFYGDDLCDPRRSAELVQFLVSEMRVAAQVLQYPSRFRSVGDLEGMEVLPAEYDTIHQRISDLPQQVTLDNHCAVLADVYEVLEALKYVEAEGTPGGSQSTLDIEQKGIILTTGGGPGWTVDGCLPTCFTTTGAGFGEWSGALMEGIDDCGGDPIPGFNDMSYAPGGSADEIGVTEMYFYIEHGCDIDPNRPQQEWRHTLWETIGIMHTRATLEASSPSVRGKAKTFVRLGLPPDGEGVTNNPPVAADAAFHRYGSAETPAVWKRRFGYTEPSLTPDLGNGDWGWRQLDSHIITLVEPGFQRQQDLVISEGCSTCEPGTVAAALSGVNVRIGLGETDIGDAGYLLIRGDTVIGSGDEILTPGGDLGLGAAELTRTASVIARPSSGGPDGHGFHFVTDSNGERRQLRTPRGLIDIVPAPPGENNYNYTISAYTGLSGDFSFNGNLYSAAPGATLERTITVKHSMERVTLAPFTYRVTGKLRIVEANAAGQPQFVTTYSQTVDVQDWTLPVPDPANPAASPNQIPIGHLPNNIQWVSDATWEMKTEAGDGTVLRREVLQHATIDPSKRSETRTVYNGNGVVAAQELSVYERFAWGEELVSHTIDPAGASLTTTYEFYQDVSEAWVGQFKEVIEPSGRWTRYHYDADNRIVKVVAQFKDRPYSESQNRVTEFVYRNATLFQHDTNGLADSTPEVVVERVEKLEGQVISRTYTIYWQWDNPTNDPYAETTVIRCSDLTAPPATPALFAAMLEAIMLDPLGSEHLVRHEKRHQREDYTGDWWMDGRLKRTGRSVATSTSRTCSVTTTCWTR